MNQTFAYPAWLNTVEGYPFPGPFYTTQYNPCKPPLAPAGTTNVNGYVDMNYCPDSYPSEVLGVVPPIVDNSFNSPIIVCPGNTHNNICLSAAADHHAYWVFPGSSDTCGNGLNYRLGAPKTICPLCLNYYRWMSGDVFGPPGYEHCTPYDATAAFNNPFCAFCPGRGYGWLGAEFYDFQTMLNNCVFSSVIEGSFVLFWFTLALAFWCQMESMKKMEKVPSL